MRPALLALACLVASAAAVQPLFFPRQVKSEWKLWRAAFDSAAAGDGRISRAEVPSLFREHFKLIHNSLPGHENHPEIDDSDVALFRSEAIEFINFVTANDDFADVSLTWDDFKQQMYNFMDAKADKQASIRKASAA